MAKSEQVFGNFFRVVSLLSLNDPRASFFAGFLPGVREIAVPACFFGFIVMAERRSQMGCFYSRGPAFLTIRSRPLAGLRSGASRVAKLSLHGHRFLERESGFVMGIVLGAILKNQKTTKRGLTSHTPAPFLALIRPPHADCSTAVWLAPPVAAPFSATLGNTAGI